MSFDVEVSDGMLLGEAGKGFDLMLGVVYAIEAVQRIAGQQKSFTDAKKGKKAEAEPAPQ